MKPVLLFLILASAGVNSILAPLRFPRHIHLREDEFPEFRSSQPPLKRWSKAEGSVEHDPVNMEEFSIFLQPAPGNSSLLSNGFELVDLHPRLVPFLQKIAREGLSDLGRTGPTNAEALFFSGGTDLSHEDKLARALQGSDSFSLGGNTVHYAFRCTGFVIRKGGPEGTKLEGTGFDNVAQRVHIDQDALGEPLLSLGLTWVFQLPFVRLINVWSPLGDVRLRPLAFADRRTVQWQRDVVRFRANSTLNAGGRLGSFQSDRLMALFHADHEWFWFPQVRFGQAIAFDTTNVPHSSFSLPGEAELGRLRNKLEKVLRDPSSRPSLCGGMAEPSHTLDPEMTLDMVAFIGSAREFLARACTGQVDPEDARAMLEYITRASLEIRCATVVMPRPLFDLGISLVGVTLCLWAIKRWRRA